MQLNISLHWFLCLLHFNELLLRHSFNTLEKSSPTGPRTTIGTFNKQIETCENLPAVNGFEMITLKNISDLMVFSFLQKKASFYFKNAILCSLLKNWLHHKRVLCSFLKISPLLMAEGIALYAPHKLTGFIMPCFLCTYRAAGQNSTKIAYSALEKLN